MSKAEDLIAASFEEQKVMSRSVINDELTIDGETREINVPESEMLFGVEGDVDIERKHFRCPKIVGDNIDLSKHLIYVAYVYTEKQNNSFLPEIGIQSYLCTDVQTEGDDITFSWKLSGNVFKNPGFIAFKVFAKEKEESPLTVFNTTPAFGIVKMTIPDGNKEIAEKYPDIINQLLTKMESVEQIATPEAMQGYVDAYLKENPVTGGMTAEQEQQLEQNTTDVADLKSDLNGKVSTNQGKDNAGKTMVVGEDGRLIPEDVKISVDNTLSNEGQAADAKATGDALKQKVDKNARDQVTKYNSEFYIKTANIYRKDRLIHNKMLISGTGVESGDPNGIISEFIEINDNNTIGIENFGNKGVNYVTFYFYGSSKNFMSSNVLNSNDNKSMNIPENAYYVRYYFNKLYLDYDYQITMPYTEEKIDAYVFEEMPEIEQKISDLKSGNFDDNVIEPKKTTFFDINENLINHDTVEKGAILGESGYFDSSFNTWTATDYIPVMKGVPYYLNVNGENTGGFTGAVYKNNKVYVQKINNQYPFIPSVSGYCRISKSSWNDKIQLNPYNPYPEYIPYGEPLTTLKEETFPCNIKELAIKSYERKKILILGDSITHLDMSNSGWVKYFSEIVKPLVKVNTAVDGATWKDRVENQIYDGNPIPSTDGNCIGNQVQKIINEKSLGTSDYSDFDVIIVAAGTNDAFNINPDSETIDDVESQFISSYGTYGTFEVVPLDTADRRTFSGIMRYTYQKLNELYPNAKFVICSPLQEVYESYVSTYKKGELFRYIASRLSVHFFNTRDCGICNLYESPTESIDYDSPSNDESDIKRDLSDGLHTNASGGKKLGEYIAKEFIKLYQPIETV